MDDFAVGTPTTNASAHLVPVEVSDYLCGPVGVVQGGLATAIAARAAAVVADGRPTRVRARLHRPTPTGTDLVAVVTPAGVAADGVEVPGAVSTWSVVVRPADPSAADPSGAAPSDGAPSDGAASGAEEAATVTGSVAIGGRPDDADEHDDLVRIALRDPLPRPQAVPAAPDCVVCGARNPHGLHLFPGWFSDGAVAEAWEAEEDDAGPGGSFVRSAVVAAVLDCPTVWAGRDHCRAHGFGGALLGGFDVTWYSRLPVGESVRIGAVLDRGEERKLFARAALVGLDGMLYAVARALQVGVLAMPGADPDLDPFGDDLDDDEVDEES